MCQPYQKHGCLENLDLCHSFANNKLIINANLQTVMNMVLMRKNIYYKISSELFKLREWTIFIIVFAKPGKLIINQCFFILITRHHNDTLIMFYIKINKT